MKREPAFWDTSALVPLCVDQPTSMAAAAIAKTFEITTWWATKVEVHSAIARLRRLDVLDETNQDIALRLFATLVQDWAEILPSDELRELASTLLYEYPLRAADSLQLAAALIWCRRKPAGRNFISSDTRLSEAAAQSGFAVTCLGIGAL